MPTGFWWRYLREGDHLEDQGINARVILKCILKKWNGTWAELIWLRIVAGSCECGNEPSGFLKSGEFFD